MESRLDPGFFAHIHARMGEIGEHRLAEMDRAGIERMVLSLTAPGAQSAIGADAAIELARRANDDLAAHIAFAPDRFLGFAHLPMQSPGAAIRELDRTIGDLGFRGALVNGHTQGRYLDAAEYRPFWARVQHLGYPIYIHPGDMLGTPAVFEGYPWMKGASWGWMNETGGHALRLVYGGVFEEFPGLTVILGHMGEALPFLLSRLDSRYAVRPGTQRLPLTPSEYIRRNIMVTTSGVNAHPPLVCSIDSMGADRVMFSVDYPFESSERSAEFLETAPIGESVKRAVAYENAARILKL
ncbi:amidohydrolase family protein [Sphingomonas sp. CA1-15]|uniref:Amidohydrolase family protein n=2 Tax=Sphingomonas immobilis TaxID=3063997 RepID=A0ABT8ZUA8_9SPHN|nr:amidohydrolase family protein [Sphingomonas sp. CA1-15]MDO7840797.1 amidohydrolase family protein [Sphingomonas sp. CA1-15]